MSSALTRSVPTPALSARNPSVPTPRYGEDSQKTPSYGQSTWKHTILYIFFFQFVKCLLLYVYGSNNIHLS